ncbi:MAG: acyl carrier protein [Saprospiraceae bacterium]|nr:acyl carrier protein [Saprospiraceae bacterium]MCB9325091.1 acyl carrier protein [Lewinellaceae bacterium]
MEKKIDFSEDRIIDLISWELHVQSSNIFPSSSLSNDLNLDTQDKMLLIAALENRLDVYLTAEEAEIVETIQDLSQYFYLHAS